MGIYYPNGTNPVTGTEIDTFDEPSLPEITPLSSAGTASRNHVQHHHDLGAAVVALQENAAWKTHDHSGTNSTKTGNKLLWANTHQKPSSNSLLTLSAARALADTDFSATSLHHTLAAKDAAEDQSTLAPGNFQAAVANHTHDYNGLSILNQPFLLCTSTTRPNNPPIGTMIYERDSNIVRVWARVNQTSGPTSFLDPGNDLSGQGLAPHTSQFTPVWQILPVARVPVFRAESTDVQMIERVANNNPWPLARFQRILQDYQWSTFGIARFQVQDVSTGLITIPEPGLYEVRAEIHWDPNKTFHDFSFMKIMVNGQEISRMNAQFTRAPILPWGYTSTPGEPQTNRISFNYRFAAGNTLGIAVNHNSAGRASWLWHNNIQPNKQTATLEVIFKSP